MIVIAILIELISQEKFNIFCFQVPNFFFLFIQPCVVLLFGLRFAACSQFSSQMSLNIHIR